jgi:PhnB protein
VAAPVEDHFWGDRFGSVIDPYGHAWGLATHVEDVPPDEMERRSNEAFAAAAGSS